MLWSRSKVSRFLRSERPYASCAGRRAAAGAPPSTIASDEVAASSPCAPRGRVSRAAAAPRRSRPCVEPEPARQVLLGRDVVLRLRRGGGLIGGCGGCGDVVSHKIIVLGIFPTTLITKLYYAILIPWQRRAEEGESGRDSLPPSTITFESRPTFDRYS